MRSCKEGRRGRWHIQHFGCKPTSSTLSRARHHYSRWRSAKCNTRQSPRPSHQYPRDLTRRSNAATIPLATDRIPNHALDALLHLQTLPSAQPFSPCHDRSSVATVSREGIPLATALS